MLEKNGMDFLVLEAYPTRLLFFQIGDAQTRQSVVAVWQPAPVFAVLMTEVLSRAIEYVD